MSGISDTCNESPASNGSAKNGTDRTFSEKNKLLPCGNDTSISPAEYSPRMSGLSTAQAEKAGHTQGHDPATGSPGEVGAQKFWDIRDGFIQLCRADALEEDPAQVFCVARLAACNPECTLPPALLARLQAVGQTRALEHIPPERIANELLLALSGPYPDRFLHVLHAGRCLCPWFHEFECAAVIPAGPRPWHTGSILEHILTVMRATTRYAPQEHAQMAAYMALMHDIGKIHSDPAALPKHHGHDRKGEPIASDIAARLMLSEPFKAAAGIAARWHMIAARYDILRPGTKVDLLMKLHRHNLTQPFFAMVRADAFRPGREGPDFLPQAERDLARILDIPLPERLHNGKQILPAHIRALQAQALAQHTRQQL